MISPILVLQWFYHCITIIYLSWMHWSGLNYLQSSTISNLTFLSQYIDYWSGDHDVILLHFCCPCSLWSQLDKRSKTCSWFDGATNSFSFSRMLVKLQNKGMEWFLLGRNHWPIRLQHFCSSVLYIIGSPISCNNGVLPNNQIAGFQ